MTIDTLAGIRTLKVVDTNTGRMMQETLYDDKRPALAEKARGYV